MSIPVALLGASGPDDWKPFAPQFGGFSVLVPGKPMQHKQNVKTAAGIVAVTFYTVAKDAETYLVGYSDFPETAVKPGTEEKHLDNAKDGAIARAKGTLESEKNIKLGKHVGRELLIRGEDKFVRTRIYAVNKRLYQTMMVGAKDSVLGKDADRFLDSFKLK
jgi:hypothetical protein